MGKHKKNKHPPAKKYKPVHIAILMMVKNEKKRLHVTLNSVKDFADSIVMYDTGSTDNTIEIAQTFCETNNIPLRLKQGTFVNFCESRNVSLAFADTFPDIDYLLLMDTNDELRKGDLLRKKCEEYQDDKANGFLVCQEWWSGQYDKYFNMRLVKARTGWRYRGRVHEWLKNENIPEDADPDVIRLPDDIVLFQDRTADDDKTGKRFERDYELLLADHKDDPTEPRTVFYLAQTCGCLNREDEALYYYKLRTTLGGFHEEVFHSYLRAANITRRLGHPWENCMAYLMKAFEHTARAEPLVFIADYYKDQKQWHLAFAFINLACELVYPHHCILFVDKAAYDWKRWHLLGIIGFYCNKFNEGKIGCMNALKAMPKSEVDKNNLEFYLKHEAEMKQNKK